MIPETIRIFLVVRTWSYSGRAHYASTEHQSIPSPTPTSPAPVELRGRGLADAPTASRRCDLGVDDIADSLDTIGSFSDCPTRRRRTHRPAAERALERPSVTLLMASREFRRLVHQPDPVLSRSMASALTSADHSSLHGPLLRRPTWSRGILTLFRDSDNDLLAATVAGFLQVTDLLHPATASANPSAQPLARPHISPSSRGCSPSRLPGAAIASRSQTTPPPSPPTPQSMA